MPIHGIGTAHPAHAMSLAEATELAKVVCCDTDVQRRTLEVVYRRSGIKNRYTCLPHKIALDWVQFDEDGRRRDATPGPTMSERMAFYEQHAGDLALQACQAALADGEVDAKAITHLITVTCTGFYAPGVDVDLMRRLPLRATTERIQVGFMGCHGAVNGLRAAAGLASNPAHRVLLCAVELCSLHYRFQWDPDRFLGNALFADGAAAVVCGGEQDAPSVCQLAATGSCLFPDSTDDLTWRIGDHGFEMTLEARVPDLIRDHLRPWLESWLSELGHSLDSIRSWAIHPGGPRIVSAVEKALALPPQAAAASREILAQYGNMSSPTILFILNHLRRRGDHRPCVALGFGPGLVAEAALFI